MVSEGRRTNLRLYAIALLITAFIFLLGIQVGNLLAEKSFAGIFEEIREIEARTRSTQLLFLLEDSPSFCPIYAKELERMDIEVEKIGYKLSYLEEKGKEDKELKNYYFLLELETFLLSKKVKEKCGANYTLLLYFYSNKNCSVCKEQGYELLETKKELGEKIRIYSFDGDSESPVVSVLGREYNVSSYPAIAVVEANRTLRTFSKKGEIIANLTLPKE